MTRAWYSGSTEQFKRIAVVAGFALSLLLLLLFRQRYLESPDRLRVKSVSLQWGTP